MNNIEASLPSRSSAASAKRGAGAAGLRMEHGSAGKGRRSSNGHGMHGASDGRSSSLSPSRSSPCSSSPPACGSPACPQEPRAATLRGASAAASPGQCTAQTPPAAAPTCLLPALPPGSTPAQLVAQLHAHGVLPSALPEEACFVQCGSVQGVFCLASGAIVCLCAECAHASLGHPVWFSPAVFERHGGMAASKKWRGSIQVRGAGLRCTLGAWLDDRGVSAKPRLTLADQVQLSSQGGSVGTRQHDSSHHSATPCPQQHGGSPVRAGTLQQATPDARAQCNSALLRQLSSSTELLLQAQQSLQGGRGLPLRLGGLGGSFTSPMRGPSTTAAVEQLGGASAPGLAAQALPPGAAAAAVAAPAAPSPERPAGGSSQLSRLLSDAAVTSQGRSTGALATPGSAAAAAPVLQLLQLLPGLLDGSTQGVTAAAAALATSLAQPLPSPQQCGAASAPPCRETGGVQGDQQRSGARSTSSSGAAAATATLNARPAALQQPSRSDTVCVGSTPVTGGESLGQLLARATNSVASEPAAAAALLLSAMERELLLQPAVCRQAAASAADAITAAGGTLTCRQCSSLGRRHTSAAVAFAAIAAAAAAAAATMAACEQQDMSADGGSDSRAAERQSPAAIAAMAAAPQPLSGQLHLGSPAGVLLGLPSHAMTNAAVSALLEDPATEASLLELLRSAQPAPVSAQAAAARHVRPAAQPVQAAAIGDASSIDAAAVMSELLAALAGAVQDMGCPGEPGQA